MENDLDAGMAKDEQPIKPDTLTTEQVSKWLSRAKQAANIHRKDIWPKYKQAKRRYNSEIGYAGIKESISKIKANHTDINLLYRGLNDFIASIFYRNPECDLSSRSDDVNEVRSVENLETALNDDIKDRESEIKAILRSALVDEGLAGLGAVYLDYDYRDEEGEPIADESGQPMLDDLGQPMLQRSVIANKVVLCKIKPENLIRPPYIQFYNYQESPYLGYVDIVPLETLRNDPTLDRESVKKIKGMQYRSLVDVDVKDFDEKADSKNQIDDLLYAKIYVLFIKGVDNRPLKRLVLSDDAELRGVALSYADWDKGHGYDDRGYPIHVLMLNESCEGFIPPSEAWILEPLLIIIDYIFEKLNRHIRKSSTKTFLKEGAGGIDTQTINKLVRNADMEYIGLNNLPVGQSLDMLIKQFQDIPLGSDHMDLLTMARNIYDHLSRQPSFSKPSVLNSKKTATETEAIQQTDSTENGDLIDKFKDFLTGIFYDWAKLIQKNMQGVKTLKVKAKKTGEEEIRPDVSAEAMQGVFKCDIEVTSFLPPNKALKRRQVKETVADLTMLDPLLRQSGKRLNPEKLVEMYVENVDMRNQEDLILDIPVRSIDQQVSDFVFKGVPMRPEELGEDYQKSLARLMQIFGDDAMMQNYEQLSPGVSSPQGPLIQFAMGLEQLIREKQGASTGGSNSNRPPTSQTATAPSPMSQNAAELSMAQTP